MPFAPLAGFNWGQPAPNLSQWFEAIVQEPVTFDPAKLQRIQTDYLEQLGALWSGGGQDRVAKDARFNSPAWLGNPMALGTAALYLLNADTLKAMAEAVRGKGKQKERVAFAVEQWVDAAAPSNFLAFNPEALQKAIDTQGQSLAQGLQHLMQDMQRGRISMTDESAFEVGRNLAVTPGSVVYQNDLFELIAYAPTTPKVYERPLLMVPPCINKYYILDLQPDNSFVRAALDQGHRVFMVSWRNPNESLRDATWDHYIENGPIQAIEAVQAITGAPTINALGFCVGGTMLGTALSVLHERGEHPVANVTFLTTLLDFAHTGVLDVFIDEAFVQYRERQFANGGVLPARELANTFSFLRPNDLVWNYVTGNYLKGEEPRPFDLLYWNGDSTNLPGPYYAWYLRNLYLENRMAKPGQCVVAGERINLGAVPTPAFFYGSQEDHIVPIAGAYKSMQLWGGPKQFVMGASGHIAGVINPPAKNKRCHWTAAQADLGAPLDAWQAQATQAPGSWWPVWHEWLASRSGKQVAAPKTLGKGSKGPYRVREAAPGSFVKVRAT
jgi:polyhydroxyalkanoate synthase